MLDRRAIEAKAASFRKEAARLKAQRDKSLTELTAARAKAGSTPAELNALDDIVQIESMQMHQAERNAEAYENVAAGRRAFSPMPGAELPRAKAGAA